MENTNNISWVAPAHLRRGFPFKGTQSETEPPLPEAEGDQQVLNQAIDYFHERLPHVKAAMAWLKQRGLADRALIREFRLGFCDRTMGLLLPNGETAEGGAIRGQMQRIGLVKWSGREFFHGSLVVPITDESGDVVDAYGRKVGRKHREGTPLHVTLRNPLRGMFNIKALQESKEIILCKSPIDALTFWCAGFHNVTATIGIRGFSEEHLEAFERYGTRRVLIAFDRTTPGDRAAKLVSQALDAVGIESRRIVFHYRMDANDYARMVCRTKTPLKDLVRDARPFRQRYEDLLGGTS